MCAGHGATEVLDGKVEDAPDLRDCGATTTAHYHGQLSQTEVRALTAQALRTLNELHGPWARLRRRPKGRKA